MDLLIATLLAGCSAAGLAMLARVSAHEASFVARLLSWRHGKPLGCPLCMGGWASFVSVPLALYALQLHAGWIAGALVWAGSVTVAAILQRAAMPQPPPVDLDELLGGK